MPNGTRPVSVSVRRGLGHSWSVRRWDDLRLVGLKLEWPDRAWLALLAGTLPIERLAGMRLIGFGRAEAQRTDKAKCRSHLEGVNGTLACRLASAPC
jgi:hypothetical protein